VNCIAPGNIRFPGGSWDRKVQQDPGKVDAYLAAEVPAGRFGRPEEIAGLAAFLCSSSAGFITGACLVADGGQTRSL
jgi:3-oxoacyl-[acyl-carrier protein] reductase